MAKLTEEQLTVVEQADDDTVEILAEYDCLIDSMDPEERAAIIDKYYDF